MKFSVSQETLLKALAVVSKGMATSSTVPILSGVYLSAFDGSLELQTNNLTVQVKHLIPVRVEEEGKAIISGKLITSIVKSLPDQTITFEKIDKTLHITCARAKFKLTCLATEDWPQFPELVADQSVELSVSLLSSMVEKVYKSASKDTTRPIYQGIQLTIEDNTIRLVTTDTFRMAVCDSHVSFIENERFCALIPATTFHDVLSMMNTSDTLLLGITENQVLFQFSTTSFITRRIEGMFPDYRQLLPKTCSTTLTFAPEELIAALRRVAVMTQQRHRVRFDIDPDNKQLTLSATSTDQGESSESLVVQAEGSQAILGLNYQYVLDCIGAVNPNDLVVFEVQNNPQISVFKINGEINFLYILMPMRL